jgi:16S rRNA (cytosine1402-N4)-methyltransferase
MPSPLPHRVQRSTPAGEHRPVLLDEVLELLNPQPGHTIVDCTVGFAGHALELLRRVGPQGKVIGIDFDADHLPHAHERLQAVGHPFTLHHGNFAGLGNVLAAAGADGVDGVDGLLADLGMSSMQLDDPERGFSYAREGPLDMRMDRTRGRTAAQLLQTISQADLAQALRELGDEPEAERLAAALVGARTSPEKTPLATTGALARFILATVQPAAGPWRLHPARGKWNTHPAARTFQVLRILVNRELANLEALLRQLPGCLRAGGKAAIISFHSGEDRLVKAAFRQGQLAGAYHEIAADPVRPTFAERNSNPRSRSAKLRWATRATSGPV